MYLSKRNITSSLRNILFLSTIVSLAVVISCVKVGPVPDFEYTYDFDASLPAVDTTSLSAENVSLTAGAVDNQGAVSFSSNVSTPATATSYAAATNTSFTAAQQTYWSGQTQASILNALETGDANAQSQVSSAINSFLGNPTLQALVPALTQAVINSSRTAARTTATDNTEDVEDINQVGAVNATQAEFDDCRQAAQDAFDIALNELDSILAVQLQDIQTRYNNQLPLIEAQRAPLEAAAQSRHVTRLGDYLTLYNSINTTISNLFTNGSITAAERDQLLITNIAIYAISVQSSLDLLNSELTLINNSLAQATANLLTNRDTMIAEANANYNTELAVITQKRSSAQNACHNQGGVNTN